MKPSLDSIFDGLQDFDFFLLVVTGKKRNGRMRNAAKADVSSHSEKLKKMIDIRKISKYTIYLSFFF